MIFVVKRGPKGADGGGPAWVSAFSAWGIRGLIFDGVRSMMGPRDTLAVGARAGVSGKGSESGKRHHGGSTMGAGRGLGCNLGAPPPSRPSLEFGGPLYRDKNWVGLGLLGAISLKVTSNVVFLGAILSEVTSGTALRHCPIGGDLGHGYWVSSYWRVTLGGLR